MRTVIIIQARMGSTRLPGKVLKQLGQYTVLDYVVSRCRKISNISEVVVATSCLSQDDEIEKWCEAEGVPCFRGDEADVLDRYYQCATNFQADLVFRVTADCPFVDIDLADKMLKKMLEAPADFITYEGELPRGLAVELFTYQALERIHCIAREEHYREHVTYFAYVHKEQFEWSSIHPNTDVLQPDLRMTLDTIEDYELCQAIIDGLGPSRFIPSKEIVAYLAEHPDIAIINSHIEQKPVV